MKVTHKWQTIEPKPNWLDNGSDELQKCIHCGIVRLVLLSTRAGKFETGHYYSKDFDIRNFTKDRIECRSEEQILKEKEDKRKSDRLDRVWNDLGNTLKKEFR